MTKLQIFLVVFVLFIGLVLKLHNYSIYPQRGATSDEYSYSFLGVSLLAKHVPISWSAISAYKHRSDLTIKNLYFPIVYPYFDHPPLNGLVVGGWALLFGQDTFSKIELKTIRLVPIFLSMVSSVIVFILGFRLYNFKTGTWALLIYSTTAIFVMNGRVVLAENLLAPLLLASVYLFHIFRANMNLKKTIIISILCGLSFWTKELGIAVLLSMIYLFIAEKIKIKFTLGLIATSLFFVLLYALYGAYYDWEVFKAVVSIQSDRVVGPETLLYVTSIPIIINKIYYDGWYFLGFISFFLSFLDYKKHRFILVPAFIYFLLMIFSLTERGEMGWYLIPLFPFMAIFTANFLVEGLEKKNWSIFALLIFVGLYEVQYLFKSNFGLTSMQFRMILILMFCPFLLAYAFKKEQLFSKLGNAAFYILIFGNILLTYNYVHPS
ncbi:MAG: glycosyltransferase family 39 protein [Patescibacteria group bacterium]